MWTRPGRFAASWSPAGPIPAARSTCISRRSRRWPCPRDDGGLKVYSATQSPTAVQRAVARVLGLAMHQVEVDVPRLGGGLRRQGGPGHGLGRAGRAGRVPAGQARQARPEPPRGRPLHGQAPSLLFGLQDRAGRGRQNTGLRGDLLPERGRQRGPLARHPGAHAVPRDQQLLHPQREGHGRKLQNEPSAVHGVPGIRRAAGHVRPGGGHRPRRRRARPAGPGRPAPQPAQAGRRAALRPALRIRQPQPLLGRARQAPRPCRRPSPGRCFQPRPRPDQERPGRDAGLLRHLLHQHHAQPGGRRWSTSTPTAASASRRRPWRWARASTARSAGWRPARWVSIPTGSGWRAPTPAGWPTPRPRRRAAAPTSTGRPPAWPVCRSWSG